MNDQQKEEVVENNDNVVQEEVDYKAKYEEQVAIVEALAKKKDELLGETKAAKKAREDALAKNKEIESQQLETLKKNGEYEKLYNAEIKEREASEQKYVELQKQIRQEKITNTSMKIANELAKGHAESADLLSVFVGQSLNEFADELGNVDENTIQGVAKQFLADKKYAPLLGGTNATGGGAPGGKADVNKSNRPEVTSDEFEKMGQKERSDFLLVKKGKII